MRRWSATFEKCESASQVASARLLDHGDYDDEEDDDGTRKTVEPSDRAAEDSSDSSDHHDDDSDDEVFQSGWPARAKKHLVSTLPSAF